MLLGIPTIQEFDKHGAGFFKTRCGIGVEADHLLTSTGLDQAYKI